MSSPVENDFKRCQECGKKFKGQGYFRHVKYCQGKRTRFLPGPIKVDATLYGRLTHRAVSDGEPITEIIRRAIRRYVG